MGRDIFRKSLIQFSVDGWSCVPSLLFTWGQLWYRMKQGIVNLIHSAIMAIVASGSRYWMSICWYMPFKAQGGHVCKYRALFFSFSPAKKSYCWLSLFLSPSASCWIKGKPYFIQRCGHSWPWWKRNLPWKRADPTVPFLLRCIYLYTVSPYK